MRIHLILTGGTIGSSHNNDGTIFSDANKNSAVLIDKLFESMPTYKELVDFETCRPLDILSENLSFYDWNILIKELKAIDLEKTDGIIITHGTDTIAYTANLLSLLMDRIDIPVFIVASAKPLSDPKANGFDNFNKAVDMLIEGTDPGVYVPYRNRDGELIVHEGCKLIQCDDLSPDFKSAHPKLNNLKIIKNYISAARFISHEAVLLDEITCINKNILTLTPQPGMDYRNYDLDYVDSVLHRTYHSSTLAVNPNRPPNSTRDYDSAFFLLDKCIEKDIPFYITPVLSNSKQVYETTSKLTKRGAIPLLDMTFEMSYIYLLLV